MDRKTDNVYFYLLFFILFILFLNFMISHIRFKRKLATKHVKFDLEDSTDSLKENSKFLLGAKIDDREYYLSINKANSQIVLSPNKKGACEFLLETPEMYKDSELLCLKICNLEPNVYINYVFPDLFDTKYQVLGSEQNCSNVCLLKFTFNTKHKKFSIKFDNGMSLCYNKESLEVFASKDFSRLKKLLTFIEKI
jgi:hypothetical protein